MQKLEIFNEADRLSVAMVLVKNGYTVRQSKEKEPKKRTTKYILEYHKSKGRETSEDGESEKGNREGDVKW